MYNFKVGDVVRESRGRNKGKRARVIKVYGDLMMLLPIDVFLDHLGESIKSDDLYFKNWKIKDSLIWDFDKEESVRNVVRIILDEF